MCKRRSYLGLLVVCAGVAGGAQLAPDHSSIKDHLCLWLRLPEVNYDAGTAVWTDVSGNGNDAQATVAGFGGPTLSSGANPTVFRHPFSALHFDPTVQELLKATDLNGGAGLTDLTIFSVQKLVAPGSVDQRAVGFGSYNDGGRANHFNMSFDVTVRKDNGRIDGKNQDHPLDAFVIYAARLDPATINMWFNSTGTLTLAFTATGSSYTTANDQFYVGDLRYPVSGDFDVAEVVVFNAALTDEQVQGVSEWLQAHVGIETKTVASGGYPPDGAVDVPYDVDLSWVPVASAVKRDVYLGTSLEDVNRADPGHDMNTLVSQGQTASTFDPAPLEFGRTYYWRVDEVNGAPDNTVFKGDVWSFTVEPFSYPLANVTATASGAQPGMEPQNTVNGSGLDDADQHSTETTQMWMTDGTRPAWIQFEFDKVRVLDKMWVWNSNQLIETLLGFGAKDVTIEYSTDGETWTTLEDVPEFAQATGTPTYGANTTVDFGAVSAKYVKLTIHSNWGGVAQQTGLSEVRFFYIPVQAFEPQPAIGATGVSIESDLAWRPGREAISHEVFFGTEAAAVADGAVAGETVASHQFTPAGINYGTTYYWKVNEVGDASTYEGDIWSFTTEPYAIVDDFESYNDDVNAQTTIWHAWTDGLTDGKSGSQVGYDISPFAERTVVHGGMQSMPLKYDNTSFAFSETTLNFDPTQDWTSHGIKSLSLYFAGAVGNAGQMYLKINSAKVAYDGDPTDLARSSWQVWNIDLSKVGNVKSVRSLTIGIEGAGAAGKLYIDDIRLYPKAPEYITPVVPAATNLVAHYTLDEGAGTKVSDSSGNGRHGTVTGSLQWVAGKIGGAMAFEGVTTEYVEAPEDPAVTGTNARTVAAWIKTTTYGEIASWGQNVAGQKWVFRVQESNGTLGAIRIEVNNGYQVGSTDVRDDQWHHVAAVLPDDGSPDAIEIALYVDGLLEANSAQSDEPVNTAAGPVRIGLAPWHNRPFTGLIDDVRIYSRPLSAEEVAGLAGRTVPVPKPF